MKNFLVYAMLFTTMILFAACSNEQSVEVKTEPVQSVDGALALTHSGIIALSDEVEIFSPISGNVMEKFVEDGSDVTEGQLLMKISELGPHSDLLQLKAELTKAKTDLAKALTANDSEAAEELKRTVEENQALVEKLEDETAVGMIYAPKSGRLGSVDAPLGMLVTANETILATVGNINPVAVRFDVSAEEARLLSTAQDLTVKLKFSDGTTYPQEGIINVIDDSTAEATFDNFDELLIPGTSAQIELDGLKISNVLLIPEKALQQRDDGNFVFVDSNKKAALKKISLGDKIGTYYIVKDGLKAGEAVVVEGMDNLREGTPLKIGTGN